MCGVHFLLALSWKDNIFLLSYELRKEEKQRSNQASKWRGKRWDQWNGQMGRSEAPDWSAALQMGNEEVRKIRKGELEAGIKTQEGKDWSWESWSQKDTFLFTQLPAALCWDKSLDPLVLLIPIAICHVISEAPLESQKRFRTPGRGMLN